MPGRNSPTWASISTGRDAVNETSDSDTGPAHDECDHGPQRRIATQSVAHVFTTNPANYRLALLLYRCDVMPAGAGGAGRISVYCLRFDDRHQRNEAQRRHGMNEQSPYHKFAGGDVSQYSHPPFREEPHRKQPASLHF